MHQTTITFPDLRLSSRDGHKLRGYFSKLFGKQSDLWHNHQEDGRPIYRYPLIQYKVVRRKPMLVGLGEGATLLIRHFLEVQALDIDGLHLPIHNKEVKSKEIMIGVRGLEHRYGFENPWFALNQDNYQRFRKMTPSEQKESLCKVLTGHILAFFKGIGHWEEQEIKTEPIELESINAKFKNQPMMMFKGSFISNAQLPDFIGLGKSVSRGYGTIREES
ncbi:MAG: hypothetical protein DHS20C18_36300 [Saprospiraceae bacterium]|nr:MAG: hypothetical protein DHS20C18_36300 [Saprospiraceae bacterium]